MVHIVDYIYNINNDDILEQKEFILGIDDLTYEEKL